MEKSIQQFHAELCGRIRSEDDAGILSRLRRICEDDYARKATLAILNLKPGEAHYDISSDTEFRMTE